MSVIREYIKSRGWGCVDEKYYSYVQEWDDWYKGYFAKFHSYRQYNGNVWVPRRRASLGMAKRICEDHASLLLNEKVSITVSEAFQEAFDDILARNKFTVRANQLVEVSFALGTGAFVEFTDERGNIVIDYVRGDMVFPISWDADDITECAFGSVRRTGGETRYYVNIHTLDERGNYVIENKLIKVNTAGQAGTGKPEEIPDASVMEAVPTESPIPRFQIIKPNVVNNIDYGNPLGVAVFANAIDVLKAVDLVFDSYCNEFRLGKKKIFVPVSMARLITDEQGITRPVFDDNDTEFYGINDDAQKEIKEVNMDLRCEEHEKGLQRFLNLLSTKCGLGNDRYDFEQGGVKTATEVISEKSDTYQNLRRNELVLESALIGLAQAVADMSGVALDPTDISVLFDDSVIEDSQATANRALLELSSGVIDKVMYFEQVYKLTEDQAIELVQKIEARANPEPPAQEPPPDDEAGGEIPEDEEGQDEG